MTMNKEKIKDINELYQAGIFNYKKTLQLNIQDSLNGVSVFRDNWEVCRIEKLSDMIEELQALRNAIEAETGIRF